MTTQQFNFDSFYERYKKVHPNCTSVPSQQWLIWFIGFSEGDGSFIIANQVRPMFVITQSIYNLEVLCNLLTNLGVGRVIMQSKKLKAARYVVQDQVGLSLIVSLFNGNMVVPTRHKRFLDFATSYNNLVNKPRVRARIRKVPVILPCNSLILPSLEDYSGLFG